MYRGNPEALHCRKDPHQQILHTLTNVAIFSLLCWKQAPVFEPLESNYHNTAGCTGACFDETLATESMQKHPLPPHTNLITFNFKGFQMLSNFDINSPFRNLMHTWLNCTLNLLTSYNC